MKCFNIPWQKTIWYTRTISATTETILLQLKSIWCEMLQHSAAENNLVHQNDFCYDRNDFPAVEMNLSLMRSIRCWSRERSPV